MIIDFHFISWMLYGVAIQSYYGDNLRQLAKEKKHDETRLKEERKKERNEETVKITGGKT